MVRGRRPRVVAREVAASHPQDQAVRFDPVELAELLGLELESSVSAFLDADARISSFASADDVHDARVALRRARSQLRTFRPQFDPAQLRAVRPEIAWATRVLGPLRDLDVVTSHLLAGSPRLGPRDLAALTTALSQRRADELRHVRAALATARHAAVLDALRGLGAAPPLRSRAFRDAAVGLAPALARSRDELRDAARGARRRPGPESFHALRTRSKQLRYASELSLPALGDDAARLARACASLQRHLGRMRDAASTASWIAEHARECGVTRQAAEEIAARELVLAEQLAGAWRRRLTKAGRAADRLLRSLPR